MCAALLMLACSSDSLYVYEDTPFLPETPPIVEDFSTFVSTEQASNVAQAFLGRHTDVAISTRMAGEEPTITTVQERGEPKMHIINYPGGGWVIVSATKNYFPVLAFSEEGSFEISDDMGGAIIWLAETKEAIQMSEAFDSETKAGMHALWRSYTATGLDVGEVATRSWSPSTPWDAMDYRIMELYFRYGPAGWFQFYSLQDARAYLIHTPAWDLLHEMAYSVGSPPEFTIVAIRDNTVWQWVGPLLTTRWHQGHPFNYLTPGDPFIPAGCVAIAMAQIMRFHRHPAHFDWNNMPNTDDVMSGIPTDFATPALIRAIGDAVGMYWGPPPPHGIGSWTNNVNARNAFVNRPFNYSSATLVNHNATQVRNEILNNRRPVYMSGVNPNTGTGHAWVGDGVRYPQRAYASFFVEFQINHWNGSFSYTRLGWSSPAQPATTSLPWSTPTLFHRNWGSTSNLNVGWFMDTAITIDGSSNFSRDRQNIFVRP